MFIEYFLLFLGLIALYLGGELAVTSCVNLSKYFRMSVTFIAAIVIGFGTSLPEFMASFIAAYRGNVGIAMGNVVGSNLANILLIYGLAITLMPFTVAINKSIKINLGFMLSSFVALFVIAILHSTILWYSGIGLLIMFAFYIFFSLKYSKVIGNDALADNTQNYSLIIDIAKMLGGLVLLLIGAHLAVDNGAAIAKTFNVPESVIGATIIAFGTSLPEVVATITAIRMRISEVIVGNVIGSCIFNVLAVLGITATFFPLTIDRHLIFIDIPLMLFAGAIVSFYVLNRKNYRAYGAIAIGLYVIYIVQNFY
ncbi:MAG: sodium:calcium antiporter [Alphaproteobacteria bacterium]|nr:sodium:calcium antiporter [Alphaproteobacteria bacterium]